MGGWAPASLPGRQDKDPQGPGAALGWTGVQTPTFPTWTQRPGLVLESTGKGSEQSLCVVGWSGHALHTGLSPHLGWIRSSPETLPGVQFRAQDLLSHSLSPC